MPNILDVNLDVNEGWTKDGSGKMVYDLDDVILKPGESKEVIIKTTYDASKYEAGTIVNQATVEADTNTNNQQTNATIKIGTKTGEENIVSIELIAGILLILSMAIFTIKKYIVE